MGVAPAVKDCKLRTLSGEPVRNAFVEILQVDATTHPFAISRNGRGHEANERDSLLRGIRDTQVRETVLADFKPVPGSRIGELTAQFDIVMGRTAEESTDESIRGGISGPERGGRGRRGRR